MKDSELLIYHYRIARATGLEKQEALKYAFGMLAEHQDINHLQIKS